MHATERRIRKLEDQVGQFSTDQEAQLHLLYCELDVLLAGIKIVERIDRSRLPAANLAARAFDSLLGPGSHGISDWAAGNAHKRGRLPDGVSDELVGRLATIYLEDPKAAAMRVCTACRLILPTPMLTCYEEQYSYCDACPHCNGQVTGVLYVERFEAPTPMATVFREAVELLDENGYGPSLVGAADWQLAKDWLAAHK